MEIFRIIVGLVMLGIVFSLGSALFHLMTDKGDSKKMVRALTLRVALSVGLFLALMAAWAAGLRYGTLTWGAWKAWSEGDQDLALQVLQQAASACPLPLPTWRWSLCG